ncbi:MAG: cysteine desulfurase family protein [Patescibacteria group bacterium]
MSKIKSVYCDYAAATPLSEQVLKAMQPFFGEQFYNPSAIYLAGKAARQSLESARSIIAKQLGARPSEIIFTAGGSEANNLAVHGVMRQYPDANCVISAVEHDSVIKPAQNYHHKIAKVGFDGSLNPASLTKQIDSKTVLVSVMLVNNELGTIQKIREIAQIIQHIGEERLKKGNNLPLILHSDACQAAYLDIAVHRLGVDLLTLNGGKIYGPKQSGVLYVRAGLKLTPVIDGGGQEFGLRSGTENVAQAVGLAKALQLVAERRTSEQVRLKSLQKRFEDGLKKLKPKIYINGGKNRSPHISHITILGVDNERLMMELDERGVQCAVGSACSASSQEPSHVLSAIGLSDKEAQSSLRFSFGQQTTIDDIVYILGQLKILLRR